jgi:hypothetical protein
MALYDDLDRHDRMAASVSLPVAAQLTGMVRLGLLAFLLVCWIAGAYAGIVYWSLQGSLLGVIASALVPGIAAASTWSAFTMLETPLGRKH